MPRNEAINTNSVVGDRPDLLITTHGSDWYFAVCAIMGISTIAFMGLALTKPQTHRMFHYITAGITAVACIAYFSMGADLGQVPIQAEFVRPGSSAVAAAGTREIFYARYIDWAITTPLLLLDLMLTAGIPLPTILITLLADEIMIVCGLIGALTRTTYKWGFWAFGTAAFLYVVYNLIWDGRKHANTLGGEPKKTFNMCGIWLIFLWFLYPIAWGLSEGANVIHPDSEAIFYGVLDIMAKPIFGALLIWGHRNINPTQLGLRIRESKQTSEKFNSGTSGGVNAPDGVTGTNGQNAAAATTTTTATNGQNV
ncbi:uncharacterized protein BCR38DRAFT_482641 [Pseudomassariella vexata]|uniref:Bacteriorhodopsin n=1 Tax=Pseudomassariella vexata TaxID=1141098 RepID=A0A1Y2E664_9PEZI|nr:uncharacterized protein BCR38DRAFT_482641 [Pseudomassariella vexata]ORY67012.1 hypothetical protein BCR38DRAFT_482641 [Pseudomassariella vexata]